MSEPMAYDDGSDVEIECEPEEPPQSGDWVDSEEMIHNPTDEELARGEFLGAAIDVDDDYDDGSKWDGFTPELLEALIDEEESR